MENQNTAHHVAKQNTSVLDTTTDLMPCQKCHKQVFENHDKKWLLAIANGSKQGRNYFYQILKERSLDRYLRSRKLSRYQYYKETQALLKRCVCGSGMG